MRTTLFLLLLAAALPAATITTLTTCGIALGRVGGVVGSGSCAYGGGQASASATFATTAPDTYLITAETSAIDSAPMDLPGYYGANATATVSDVITTTGTGEGELDISQVGLVTAGQYGPATATFTIFLDGTMVYQCQWFECEEPSKTSVIVPYTLNVAHTLTLTDSAIADQTDGYGTGQGAFQFYLDERVTDAPEPAGWWMVAGALIGVRIWRRTASRAFTG